ncbi:hypothetical protein D3C72_1358080 [compost metagenome]
MQQINTLQTINYLMLWIGMEKNFFLDGFRNGMGSTAVSRMIYDVRTIIWF